VCIFLLKLQGRKKMYFNFIFGVCGLGFFGRE
jgi:hypothetical protein